VPPVRVRTTASAAPFVRTAPGAAAAPPFVVSLSPSQAELLEAAAGGESDIGVTLFLPEDASLWATSLGAEPVAVIVNPANGTGELSLGQVQDIYAGRSTQWAAAVREDGDDSRLYFESAALRGLRPAATIRVAPSPEAMLAFVAGTPNGIGYLPLHWVDQSVKTLAIDGKRPGDDGYPLTALVVAVAIAEPAGAAREWLVKMQDGGEK
jgi:ABC-type phosphate transport system substrate-binding protein